MDYYLERAKLYQQQAQQALSYMTRGETNLANLLLKNLKRSYVSEMDNMNDKKHDFYTVLVDINSFLSDELDEMTELEYMRNKFREYVLIHEDN